LITGTVGLRVIIIVAADAVAAGTVQKGRAVGAHVLVGRAAFRAVGTNSVVPVVTVLNHILI
jgi:hypothetical protein